MNLPEHLLVDARMLQLIKSTHPEWGHQECENYLRTLCDTHHLVEGTAMATVENCWDFMKCGREAGGVNADELGVCPAYTQGVGQACWFVAGTFFGEDCKGTSAIKIASCVYCDFYKQFDIAHKARMSAIFYAKSSSIEHLEAPHDSRKAHQES
jgi:hypothetical protein